jgi:hypothetical protein
VCQLLAVLFRGGRDHGIQQSPPGRAPGPSNPALWSLAAHCNPEGGGVTCYFSLVSLAGGSVPRDFIFNFNPLDQLLLAVHFLELSR